MSVFCLFLFSSYFLLLVQCGRSSRLSVSFQHTITFHFTSCHIHSFIRSFIRLFYLISFRQTVHRKALKVKPNPISAPMCLNLSVLHLRPFLVYVMRRINFDSFCCTRHSLRFLSDNQCSRKRVQQLKKVKSQVFWI